MDDQSRAPRQVTTCTRHRMSDTRPATAEVDTDDVVVIERGKTLLPATTAPPEQWPSTWVFGTVDPVEAADAIRR